MEKLTGKPINTTYLFWILCLGVWISSPSAVHAVTMGNIRSYSTIYSIGIEWDLTNDPNHNATCAVQYKTQGSGTWQMALPLFRVDFKGFDMLAGSVLFLEPGTSYEVKLVVSDPDGGSVSQTETVNTRPIPAKPTSGRTFHVVPGSGGGAGSEADPYQGITAAQAAAQPGDIFLLHAGTYQGDANGRVNFTTPGDPGNYLVWEAHGDGEVIFDTGVSIQADHIWMEGIHVKSISGGDGLTVSGNREDVVISKNIFSGWYYSIRLRGISDNWYIADNIIVGISDPNKAWDAPNNYGEGIELAHTSGHTVAHNTISRVGDGISYPVTNVDIFGNDIFDLSANGIETDYGYANLRVWGNRLTNVNGGGPFSFQPMNGAPWYFIRNQAVARGNVLKLRSELGGVLLAHNTFVSRGQRLVSNSYTHELINIQSNNNLWITAYDGPNNFIWENSSSATPNWKTNLDYDGFDWWNAGNAFKWEGVRHPDLASLRDATGLEEHGIVVNSRDGSCFENFDVPLAGPIPLQNMALSAGSSAIDKGIALANINDGYRGAAPDLGAYEHGAELPHYGARINFLVISTLKSLPAGSPGVSYSQKLSAVGGQTPYSWSVKSGSLPQGLSLTATGSIQGTPTTPGNFSIWAAVVDSSEPFLETSKELTITITDVISDPVAPEDPVSPDNPVVPEPESSPSGRNFIHPHSGSEIEIIFTLDSPQHVEIQIFSRARMVRNLISQDYPAGPGVAIWDGRNDLGEQVSSGIYHAVINSEDNNSVQKLAVIR